MPAILADTLAVLRAHTDHSVEWELDGQRLPVSFIALQGGSTIIELVDGNDVTTVNCDTGTIRLVMGEVYPEIPETGGYVHLSDSHTII
jgi:hypothetical protein